MGDNEIPPQCIHKIKTKGHDAIGVNIFLRQKKFNSVPIPLLKTVKFENPRTFENNTKLVLTYIILRTSV